MRQRLSRAILAGCLIAFGVIVIGYLSVVIVIGKTRQQVLEDQAKLQKGEVIFPIAHYHIKGQPGPIYRDRLDTTIALWRERPRPIWLLAGRNGIEESSAGVGKRYLIDQGISTTAIKILDEFPRYGSSLDTQEEIGIASRIAKQTGVSTIIVVAEITHLAQARLVFSSYGVNIFLVSTPETRYGPRYRLTRIGALLVTFVDRRGHSLFWLRWIRKGWANWPD